MCSRNIFLLIYPNEDTVRLALCLLCLNESTRKRSTMNIYFVVDVITHSHRQKCKKTKNTRKMMSKKLICILNAIKVMINMLLPECIVLFIFILCFEEITIFKSDYKSIDTYSTAYHICEYKNNSI